MTEPHYADDWLTIYGGDCREVLASLPSDSVDCVVTSPPYWGLRDYGTATWTGGDVECDHVQRTNKHGGTSNRPGLEAQTYQHRETCGKCGATRIDSQLGLERTPEEYVANMVAVFREVRRVLKPSGTCWLNLGDSYNNRSVARPSSHQGGLGFENESINRSWADGTALGLTRLSLTSNGLKEKDLVGIPWRVAFALQADGWYLRSDIIWSKPNPMPESVTDRPTKSHEYLFMLSKQARYYFDADAVREPHAYDWEANAAAMRKLTQRREWAGQDESVLKQGGQDKRFNGGPNPAGRNIRSVWSIATRPYPGAHFAVFPPELPERCIKAGSPQAGLILDPFAGSGTVGMVANRLSRRAILIDLNPQYLRQQMTRNAQVPLGLGA